MTCLNCGRSRGVVRGGCGCVPPDFWERSEVVRALSVFDLSEIVRLLGQCTALTQSEIAFLVGVSQSMVAHVQARRRSIGDIAKIRAALVNLGAPNLVPKLKAKPTAVVPGGRDGANQEAGLLQTGLLQSLLAGQKVQEHGPHHGIGAAPLNGLGPGIAQSAQMVLKMFLHLDDQMGGGNLYAPLNQYLSRLAVTVDQNPQDGLHVFGQLSQMAGWLALETGHHGAARRHLTSAVYAGYEADVPELSASALAYQSLQATYQGRLKEALSLAQTATGVGTAAPPLVETMLNTRLARAHAKIGEESEARKSLDQARTAFEQAGQRPEPDWICYVDEVELLAQEGACYLDLNLTGPAVDTLSHAVDLLSQKAPHRLRDQAHYLVRIAKCYLARDEIEAACTIAVQALQRLETVHSPRVIDQFVEFQQELIPWREVKEVQDFNTRFRSLASTS